MPWEQGVSEGGGGRTSSAPAQNSLGTRPQTAPPEEGSAQAHDLEGLMGLVPDEVLEKAPMIPLRQQQSLGTSPIVHGNSPLDDQAERLAKLDIAEDDLGCAREENCLENERDEDIRASEKRVSSSRSQMVEFKSHSNELMPSFDSVDQVIIHVCDETKGINRDFSCDRTKLLTEMKYFESYLGGNGNYDEIDISVHCDVQVFEWLIQYINLPNNPPSLNVGSAISILISSDFLLMERLVTHCVEFVSSHLNEILQLPLDLSCLNDHLVLAIAKRCSPEVLAAVKDKKDKLLSKLFKKRLEIDFRERGRGSSARSGVSIRCCQHCLSLFPSNGCACMVCPAAPVSIGFHGELIGWHSPREEWSLTAFVGALHSTGAGWPEIYWLLWGLTRTLYCSNCNNLFTASNINRCRFHPNQLILRETSFEGRFSCCDQAAMSFSVNFQQPGCQTRKHAPDERTEEGILHLLELQEHYITGSGLPEGTLESAIRVGADLPPLDQDGNDSEPADDGSTDSKRTKRASRAKQLLSSGSRPHSALAASKPKLRKQISRRNSKEIPPPRKGSKEDDKGKDAGSYTLASIFTALPSLEKNDVSGVPWATREFEMSTHPLLQSALEPSYCVKLSKEQRMDVRKMRMFEMDFLREDDIDRIHDLSQALKNRREAWAPGTEKDASRVPRPKSEQKTQKTAR